LIPMRTEQASLLASFGYCASCKQMHAFPEGTARVHALRLMEQLREHRRLDFEIPEPQANPLASTASLYSDLRGKMIGVLVCEDAQGKEVILKAFSSKHNGTWTIPGWVPPLIDEILFNAAIQAGNTLIHPLTASIDLLEKTNPNRGDLVNERRLVSNKVLANLTDLYEVHNFRGQVSSLAGAFIGKNGIPTGTGDCCAPKLLNYAAQNKLKPLGLVEFFWGKETASGQRVEGEFYASCEEKCQPLLGFMLCGL
jgi:hypothetical protein